MAYTPPNSQLDGTWQGADGYARPENPHFALWGGIDLGTGIRRLAAQGHDSSVLPAPYTIFSWEYAPPTAHLDASWEGATTHTPAEVVEVAWSRGAGGDQYVTRVTAEDTSIFGAAQASYPQFVSTDALDATVFGEHGLEQVFIRNAAWYGSVRYVPPSVLVDGWWTGVPEGGVFPAGVVPGGIGRPNLANKAIPLNPGAMPSGLAIGAATIWNWRQHQPLQGFAAQLFGEAYVQGGVKFLSPAGVSASSTGAVTVINTRAEQSARGAGAIAPLELGQVSVSPRMLRPGGAFGTAFGIHRVQFPPRPLGWLSSTFGYAAIEYKTKAVLPGGVDAFSPGFPRVADWARRILHVASPVTSVFGDTALRLKNFRVQVPGIHSLEMSVWAEVRNRNRTVQVPGIALGVAGESSIQNKTPSFAPQGFDASKFGTHDVGFQVRSVRPAGLPPPAPAFGLPSMWQTPALKPLGTAPPAVPAPAVQNAVRYLDGTGGTAMASYGRPMVGYRYRHIAPGGVEASGYGQPRLEHRDRTLLARSLAQTAYGTPLLTLARRFLSPVGIKPVEDGANHMVGGTRWLRPLGFGSTRWGTRIIPEAQVLFPLGFGGAFGWPRLENRHQHIRPDSIRLYAEPQQYFGLNRAFNLRQFVTMFYDVDSALNPPRWPQWTLIENRNKRMGVSGWDASKVPAPHIENNARVLLPAGMSAPALPEWQKTGMVAFRIRPLHLDGLEPPYISSWANVRNAARVLKPAEINATLFGAAKAENRSREFSRIGGWDSAWCGYPFVAPRIRELTFEGRYTIVTPIVPLPWLQLHTRYIEPAGIAPKEVGAASLSIRFNRITPRWTMVNYYGYPVVHNVTPELRQRGAAMDEWGNANARLQWRPVVPDGTNMALIGKPIIADRRRTIAVPGANMLRIGDNLTVTKTGVPPLATQYLWLDSLDPANRPDNGNGIAEPHAQVGMPSLQQHVVYLDGIDPEGYFGRPIVTANSIRVEPGIFELTAGEPVVSLRRRTIKPGELMARIEPGKPRLSPHTIYAVMDAPTQAMVNHTATNLHYVQSRVEFGLPKVESQHRGVAHKEGFGGMAFGRAELHSTRQYVAPSGTVMSRMGWPVFPGDTRLEFYTTISTMQMGWAAVSRPPYIGPQSLAAHGLAATLFAASKVEHRNRSVLASGHDSMAMGTKKADDTPFMWQRLRVGELVPNIPQGFSAEQFGDSWISNRVRQLPVEGFDAFVCEYDYRAFARRMRVRHAALEEPVRQMVLTGGFRSGAVGVPSSRHGAHFIRPDGNSDQHRKGAF
jgi:hypothetical protein